MNSVKIPKGLIKRGDYLAKIRPFIGKPLAKVITGQRRVGKSYFLYQIIEYISSIESDANFIYINKEDFRFDAIRTGQDLNEYVENLSKTNQKNVILIDEIQEIRSFEKAIRSLLLDENNDIYITGSNADLLSGEFATVLGGRTIELPIYSLTYPEFLLFHELNNNDESLNMYFKYGGLPYLKNLELTDRIVNEYLTNIYNSIIYRDIVSRYHVRSTYFLEQLVRFLSANIGSLFSAKRISDYLKSQQVNIPPNQVQTYISYLAKAFIIHRLQRYDIQGKRVFEMGEKLYFENMGIRNSICGYRPDDQGKLMENIVLNHLLVKGYAVHVGSFKGQEIDFLASREGELKYIQVALYLHEEKTIKREFGNLLNIKDNYPKMVVTMDKKFPNTYEGITHYTLRDFLLNKL